MALNALPTGTHNITSLKINAIHSKKFNTQIEGRNKRNLSTMGPYDFSILFGSHSPTRRHVAFRLDGNKRGFCARGPLDSLLLILKLTLHPRDLYSPSVGKSEAFKPKANLILFYFIWISLSTSSGSPQRTEG